MENIKTYKVRFAKVKNNHNALRDDVIDGETTSLPVVGHPFVLTAPPRDSGNVRVVATSPVKTILSHCKGTIEFETKTGSIYAVTTLNF